jgi:hypothetical protein
VSGKRIPKKLAAAMLETMADELRRLYPHLDVRVHRPGQKLPPGAVQLPAVDEVDLEAVRDRPARDRRLDDDPRDP